MRTARDLSGQRFGKLIVIDRAENKVHEGGTQSIQWNCECECGNRSIVTGSNLKNGHTKSCGCGKQELYYTNLSGNRYGRLLVLVFSHSKRNQRKGYSHYWKCLCDCGKEINVSSDHLKGGHTKSCGCLRKDHPPSFNDLTGMVFGRLTVIERAFNKGNRTSWLCECTCGTRKIITGGGLVSKNARSCGCLHKEMVSLAKGQSAFNRIYHRYKYSKNASRLGFELTIEQFKEIINKNCFYCGIRPEQITYNKKGNGEYIYNGIDRINNDQGYTFENSVPCCKICNKAKLAMDVDSFFEWLKRAYLYSIESKNII